MELLQVGDSVVLLSFVVGNVNRFIVLLICQFDKGAAEAATADDHR